MLYHLNSIKPNRRLVVSSETRKDIVVAQTAVKHKLKGQVLVKAPGFSVDGEAGANDCEPWPTKLIR